jgi:two-component sensor histidine kinase
VYFYLAKADSARGYNALALRDYKTFRQLNDSIFTQEKNHQIQELMIKYDVRQKEKDYDILRKQTQIQKAELQKAQLLTKITIAGIMLLLLATALLYAYIRNRRRSESLLSQHQDEITRKNLSLENLINKQNKLIKDKEWLIKEIHHRVKNNLQVVMSLLNTQMQYLDNALVVSALTDSQTRLYSISLIHQKLFQNDQVAFVEIRPYIIELIKFLHETFHFEDKIRFDYDIEELNLDITHAIPLGLIINEAITNAIKYAFPNNRKGNVTLSLKSAEGDNYELIIKDNGIGLSPDFKPELSQTLGMVLMRGLSSQLGGDIKVINSTGVQVNLLFPQIMPDEAEIELLDDENLKNI